ncbi:MAG: DnaJ domain-containing protein [Desulfovibrio sp.]|nr:DnaJ domain-containing protein [Desulfovibrio sp.]
MRRTSSFSLKDCYQILGVARDANLEDVKHAYRKKAFALHPDLNPDDPEASKKFQLVNEAYVALAAVLKAEEKKEESEEKAQEKTETHQEDKKRAQAEQAYAEQDVLRDLLKDPFARRVFEDIYSDLNKKAAENQSKQPPKEEPKPTPPPSTNKKRSPEHVRERPKTILKTNSNSSSSKMGGFVKNWLRRQIDDELTIYLPQEHLVPGKRVRLQISHAFTSEPQTVEVTLPKDFAIGKPIRLRGLGKHVGPWQGDLYLILQKK